MLGQLVEPVITWNPSREIEGESFQYIDLSAVDQESKAITGTKELLCKDAPSRARQIVSRGDILVSTVRPNLNGVAQVPEQLDGATASTGFCVLRPKASMLDARYLFNWAKSPQFVQNMVRMATGASYPAVSDRIILDSTIPLPPLPEQRRIAEVLDKLEALRAKTRELICILESCSKAIFLDMFGDPTVNPMAWPIKLLGDLSVRITKGESPKWQGHEYQEDGALFVTSENVRLGMIDLSKPKFVPLEFNEKLRRSELKEGDLLVNLVGASIGRSCIFPGFRRPANINQAVGVVTIDTSSIELIFVAHLLTSDHGQRLLLNNRVEGARANISLTDLRELPIPTPPLKLQQEFGRRIGTIEILKSTHRASLAQLDALLASLQHRAFRGEL